MFEKEAEEYAENREVCGLLDAISENLQNYDYGTVAHYNIDPLVEECFQDGAEFGYNKANEEMQEQGLALQSDMDKTIEQNIQLKKELNKANEWHYVKDGEYPKECDCCLLYLGSRFNCITGWRHRGVWCFEDDRDLEMWQDEVIAWKEIVLPKEIKEK